MLVNSVSDKCGSFIILLLSVKGAYFVLWIFSSCLTRAFMPAGLAKHISSRYLLQALGNQSRSVINLDHVVFYKCCKLPNRLLFRKQITEAFFFFCIQIRIRSCVSDNRKVRHDNTNLMHEPASPQRSSPSWCSQTWTALSPTYLLIYSLRTPINWWWQNQDKGKLIT